MSPLRFLSHAIIFYVVLMFCRCNLDSQFETPNVEGNLSFMQNAALYGLRVVTLFAFYWGSLPFFMFSFS